MEFKELTNEQWESIRALLPPRARTGRPRADDRTVTNGILYVLTSGCRWADLPRTYGSGKTAWRRFKHLQEAGTWDRLVAGLQGPRPETLLPASASTMPTAGLASLDVAVGDEERVLHVHSYAAVPAAERHDALGA